MGGETPLPQKGDGGQVGTRSRTRRTEVALKIEIRVPVLVRARVAVNRGISPVDRSLGILRGPRDQGRVVQDPMDKRGPDGRAPQGEVEHLNGPDKRLRNSQSTLTSIFATSTTSRFVEGSQAVDTEVQVAPKSTRECLTSIGQTTLCRCDLNLLDHGNVVMHQRQLNHPIADSFCELGLANGRRMEGSVNGPIWIRESIVRLKRRCSDSVIDHQASILMRVMALIPTRGDTIVTAPSLSHWLRVMWLPLPQGKQLLRANLKGLILT